MIVEKIGLDILPGAGGSRRVFWSVLGIPGCLGGEGACERHLELPSCISSIRGGNPREYPREYPGFICWYPRVCWVYFGDISARPVLGTSWEYLEDILRVISGDLGCMLGTSWDILGVSWVSRWCHACIFEVPKEAS